ncbi:MAG: GNAT family N-acetyltransferase [Bacteroidetes bacterium]|nr:GNAT family N-acetyltransferase [Bacteroidota bacterium]
MPTYQISTDKSLLNKKVIHEFISNSYWAKEIPMEILELSIENSICFGVYENDVQVGFARVVTDKATFGYLADVFILESHRGKGLSKMLMDSIMSHPDLQGLRRFMLATRDAHGLYAQYGFTPVALPDRLMEIVKKDLYLKK